MSRYAKFISAALAALGVIVSAGVLDGDAQEWAASIVSALGAALVYFVPNTPPAGEAARPDVSETDPVA